MEVGLSYSHDSLCANWFSTSPGLHWRRLLKHSSAHTGISCFFYWNRVIPSRFQKPSLRSASIYKGRRKQDCVLYKGRFSGGQLWSRAEEMTGIFHERTLELCLAFSHLPLHLCLKFSNTHRRNAALQFFAVNKRLSCTFSLFCKLWSPHAQTQGDIQGVTRGCENIAPGPQSSAGSWSLGSDLPVCTPSLSPRPVPELGYTQHGTCLQVRNFPSVLCLLKKPLQSPS